MYLKSPMLSDEQFRYVALAETIYFPETYKILHWPYMKEKWWQFGYTELVAMWGKGSGKDYCLAGSEKYLTRNGVLSLEESVWSTQEILTDEGFVPAQIEAFGLQPVSEVELQPATLRNTRWGKLSWCRPASSKLRRKITASDTHRWELVDHSVKTTAELRPGDLIRSNKRNVSRTGPEYEAGFRHGFIFGDGTIASANANGTFRHRVHFYGDKDEVAKAYFSDLRVEQSTASRVESYRGTAYLIETYSMKEVPAPGSDPDYVSGFYDGWLAADGNLRSEGSYQLQSSNHDALAWAADHAPLAGYVVTGSGEKTNDRTNYSVRTRRVRWLSLNPNTVSWRVSSVNPKLEPQEVYCAVVPEKERFTLAGGVYTSNCARVICARAAYLMMCLKDPHAYYRHDPAAKFNILNVAMSAEQANEVFFEPLRTMVGNSPWFADKHEAITRKMRFAKGIMMNSGHADQESLEGSNLMIGVADEIAAFKTKAERLSSRSPRSGQQSADAIGDMMRTSGQSRFPGLAKVCYLSFPRFQGDYITTKYATSVGDPTVYATKKATWEVNPTKSRRQFDNEYRKDPEGSRAKYECDPPLAVNKYFRSNKLVNAAFQVDLPEHLRNVFPVDDLGYFLHDWRFDHSKPCAAHLDLALTNDRAGIAIAHVSDWTERQTADGQVLKQPIVFVDVITSFAARELGMAELDMEMLESFVVTAMQRGCRLKLVTADQYQSAYMLQNIDKMGVEVKKRSVDRDTSVYDALKGVMYSGRLVSAHRERVITEIKSLELINGVKIDHPPGGSKDEADALAGAVAGAIELAYQSLGYEIHGMKLDWTEAESEWYDQTRGRAPWSKQARFTTLGTPQGKYATR